MFNVARDHGLTAGVGSPEITDLERRVSDIVNVGRVVEADYAKALVKVGIGDPDDEGGYIKTGWLPMAGGRSDEWNPIQVGEAVSVISESGEIQNGVVSPGSIYNTDNPAPGDRGDLWRKRFADGAVLEYDQANGGLKFTSMTTTTINVGSASIVITGSSITLTAGGQTFTIGGAGATSSGRIRGNDGLEVTGAPFTHDGKDVGKSHRHLNSGGPSTGGIPI